MKKLVSILALFVFSLLSLSLVNAAFIPGQNLTVENVQVNDLSVQLLSQTEVSTSGVDARSGVVVEEGEEVEVEMVLVSTANIENVQVEAEIRGYEYDDYEDVSDRVHVFDLQGTATAPSRKKVSLHLTLPRQLDEDRYLLRVTVDDKDSPSLVGYVVLQVEPTRHGIDVADVVFSPGTTVRAGRSLLATVLLENYGDRAERDVKVVVEIPELGVRAAEFVDKVDVDSTVDTAAGNRVGSNIDYEDVPEMFLPIPVAAKAGEYEVVVRVFYDNLREEIIQKHTINVVVNPMFAPTEEGERRLVLAVGPQAQTVKVGEKAMYAIALTNEGRTSEAYTMEVVSGDWATATLSKALVVLASGRNEVVYVDVTPKADATLGSHVVTVAVKKGAEVLETVTLNANVAPASQPQGETISLRNGLEIALIVLVVLLVIIGLIVGFSRLRKDDGEEQTYY